jgi:predicted phage-related endonuclease
MATIQGQTVGKLTPDDQLSASELPVLMGMSRYKTVNELLKEKTEFINGKERENITNEAMTWGNLTESIILEESARRLGVSALKLDHTEPYQHKTAAVACSLDGTADGDGIEIMTDIEQGIICVNADKIKLDGVGVIEAKLTSHEVESADQLPLYRGPLQLQMQMDIMGATWGAVCVLYKGTQLKVFVYERDEEVLTRLHESIADFQRRLDRFKSEDFIEWYDITDPTEASKLWDDPNNVTVDIPEVEEYAQKIIEIRDMINDLEAQSKDMEIKIMDKMRDVAHAHAGRYKISWPTINYKAVPEKVVPAKPARTIRQSKLRIRDRELNNE